MKEEILTITGLTPLEVRELESKVGRGAVQTIGHRPSNAAFREPISLVIATVGLSSLALSALAVIATRPKQSLKRVIRIERKKGDETLAIAFEEEAFSSEAPDPKVVEKIGKALRIDLKSLAESIQQDK